MTLSYLKATVSQLRESMQQSQFMPVQRQLAVGPDGSPARQFSSQQLQGPSPRYWFASAPGQ